MRWLHTLLLLTAAIAAAERHTVSIDTRDGSQQADFVASNDWQEVRAGQKIPPGLHVRMNLQTGRTEAKLVDAADDAKSNLPALAEVRPEAGQQQQQQQDSTKEPEPNSKPASLMSEAELKQALKKVKGERVSDSADMSKFRPYSELRKDFAKLQAKVQTDSEILRQLLQRWNSTESAEERLALLQDVEYLVHQIDNAENFVRMGGLELLSPLLNDTGASERLSAAALKTLAAAAQGNAKVQIAAVRFGMLQLLVRQLQQRPGCSLQPQLILGIASLTRNFPFAQTLLLRSGGLAAMKAAFISEPPDARTQLRIATLITDFVAEAAAAAGAASVGTDTERRQQYAQAAVAAAVAETGWCRLLPALLNSSSDHDAAEKAVITMATLVDTCGAEFADWRQKLAQLAAAYRSLAQQELSDEGAKGFFSSLYSRIVQLQQRLHPNDEL